MPVEWEALRRQWEFSHAVNAGVTFLALCSVVLSVVLDGERGSERA